jgi:chemotaxis protein methyltransferase CheR
MELSDREYMLISRLVYKQSGIKLGDQKRSLIVGRLQKILRQHGFTTFSTYYDWVMQDATGQALQTLLDRISTNHTFFFRESDHFEFFYRDALPLIAEDLAKKTRNDVRIWCPGCSTGEEPYTLAMLVTQYFDGNIDSWDIGILATDIAESALKAAMSGVYMAENVKDLPGMLAWSYLKINQDGSYTVKEKIKELVTFRRLNLMRETYPFKGRFQVIFCRNVMIYFDAETRQELVRKFHRCTEPGGYLFIGHAESLGHSNDLYEIIKPAVYRRI